MTTTETVIQAYMDSVASGRPDPVDDAARATGLPRDEVLGIVIIQTYMESSGSSPV